MKFFIPRNKNGYVFHKIFDFHSSLSKSERIASVVPFIQTAWSSCTPFCSCLFAKMNSISDMKPDMFTKNRLFVSNKQREIIENCLPKVSSESTVRNVFRKMQRINLDFEQFWEKLPIRTQNRISRTFVNFLSDVAENDRDDEANVSIKITRIKWTFVVFWESKRDKFKHSKFLKFSKKFHGGRVVFPICFIFTC